MTAARPLARYHRRRDFPKTDEPEGRGLLAALTE